MEETTTPSTTPPPPAPTPTPVAPSGSSISYVIAAVTLVVGLGLGYLLTNALATKPAAPKTETEVALPTDTVRIQSCANNKGALYAKSTDIPLGPLYMVNGGKVIGIEFMLSKDEFLSGKSYKFLTALGGKVDHLNVGLLSQGHEGYPIPHYHVDLYFVSKEVEQAITCTSTSTPATGSGTPATQSANP